MNPHLTELLAEVGIEETGDAGFWRRVLVVRATGAIPGTLADPEAFTWHGFHLVVLDERGRPVERIKCRSPLDEGFEWECRTMAALGNEPRLRGIVPRTATAASDRVRIHRTPQIEGEPFRSMRGPDDAKRWRQEARDVLQRVRRIVEVGEELGLERPRRHPVAPVDRLAPALRVLSGRGLPPRAAEALRVQLHEASLPLRVQFGDLWPGNLLRVGEGWCFLDFERFAAVDLPLFDALHLIWSSGPTRSTPGVEPLFELARRVRAGEEGGDAAAELLAECAEFEGVPRELVPAAVLACAIELAAYRARPGMPEAAWRPLVRDLEVFVEPQPGAGNGP